MKIIMKNLVNRFFFRSLWKYTRDCGPHASTHLSYKVTLLGFVRTMLEVYSQKMWQIRQMYGLNIYNFIPNSCICQQLTAIGKKNTYTWCGVCLWTALVLKWDLYQMYAKNTFLGGYMGLEVFRCIWCIRLKHFLTYAPNM